MSTDRSLAFGVDLGGTKVEAAALDAAGQVVWRERRATPAGDYLATLDTIVSLTGQARQALGASLSIGIGHPGAATATGRIKNANSTCLNGQPLQHDLEARLGQSIRMANDANCLALSEATDGAGAGANVVFSVILGTGTGAGIAVGGRVLAGANGLAGEWGHNPLPWARVDQDPVLSCYCGQSGCIETLVSGPGLASDHLRHTGDSLTADEIGQKAAKGCATSQATLERHSSRLARALAGVINLLDPDVIVLGGGLSLLPSLPTRVPQLWDRWVFSAGAEEPVRTRLVLARHGDASGVRGAAWLWR